MLESIYLGGLKQAGSIEKASKRRFVKKRASKRIALALSLVLTWAGAGCSAPGTEEQATSSAESPIAVAQEADRETLSQVSTLGALVSGIYDGLLPIEEVSRRGDFGLGTFEHLDGEMVQLADGIFRVNAQGEVAKPALTVRTPFFVTTFFDSDLTFEADEQLDLPALMAAIDARLPSTQLPWAIRIEGTFSYLKTRSVPAQEKPYPALGEVLKTQPTFEFTDVSGTLVGFRLPEYLAGVNLVGHHFHFLTADRSGGGHVLELQASGLTIEADETPKIHLTLPDGSQAFRDLKPAGSD